MRYNSETPKLSSLYAPNFLDSFSTVFYVSFLCDIIIEDIAMCVKAFQALEISEIAI